jgi:hypothetical protein
MIEGPVYLCHLRPCRHAVAVGVSVLLKHPDAGDEVQYATCSLLQGNVTPALTAA